MKKIAKIFFASGALLLSATPLVANAFIITDETTAGSTFAVTWSLAAGATDPNGNTNDTGEAIEGGAIFTLLHASTDGTTDVVAFEVALSNTTVNNSDELGLYKFGFSTDPNATVIEFSNEGSYAGDPSDDVDKVEEAKLSSECASPNGCAPNLSNSVGSGSIIEVVTSTDSGTSPQQNQTLLEGETDVFKIALEFQSPALNTTEGIAFTPFAVFYQSKSGGSWQFPGGDNGGGDDPSGEVPIPGTLALLAIGALALRRRLAKN